MPPPASNWMKRFANMLKHVRNETGMTQKELARRLGVSESTISHWENCSRPELPNAYYVAQICKTLNVSSDVLVDLKFEEKKDKISGNGIDAECTRYADGGSYNIEDIDAGIQLFKSIVIDGKNIQEIQNGPTPVSSRTQGTPQRCRRVLKSALFSGAIRIIQVAQDTKRENELKKKYNLQQCVVAKLDGIKSDDVIDTTIRSEVIALLAAFNLGNVIKEAHIVAFGGGSIVSRFCDLMQPASATINNTEWVSLLSTPAIYVPRGGTANSIVARMVYSQPGSKGCQLPFICHDWRNLELAKTTSLSDAVKKQIIDARTVLEKAKEADAVIMSVGAMKTNYYVPTGEEFVRPLINVYENEMNSAEKSACQGDILRRFVDDKGQRVGSLDTQKLIDEYVYSIDLDDLNKIVNDGRSVYIVAGRKEKAKVIRGAFLGGRANCLITENTLADALLQEE